MIKSASNDQIILVLQYYEDDVDRTISAFLEGNASSYQLIWSLMVVFIRHVEFLFCGIPTSGLENLGLQTPTPALKNLDSRDLLSDIMIVYLWMSWEKF